MRELQAVIEAYRQAGRDNVQTALATVVHVEGSAYRRPGARMLMTEKGQMTGSLSGGCLERDVFERALAVMKTREPAVVRYDTGSTADIVWGLGLGCNGVVHVLIEPLDNRVTPRHFELLADCMTGREPCVIATVFGVRKLPSLATPTDGLGVAIGSRLLLQPNGCALVEFEHDELTRALMQDAHEALSDSASSVKVYELAEGAVEVFVETIDPPVPLVIFGAGADSAPVLELAQKLGWHVTIVDTQARDASRERFGDADSVLLVRPEEVAARVPLTPRTMALVMTHNYEHDFELFKSLLRSPARYIGMMGPKRRTERIISEAAEGGMRTSDKDMHRLHAPVGLDLGAETPEEIALSVVAEIRAVLANHGGGFLKDRTAPIHAARSPAQHKTLGGSTERRAEPLEGAEN
jgi:xanthine dehydrogenase accessory factor